MSSGVGTFKCVTKDFIKWEIPSFHLLPLDENTRIWSPVFVYYYKHTNYAVPLNNFFLETPEKSLGLIITSGDFKYNQIKPVQIGVTDATKAEEINRCDGVWIERTDGNKYIKVDNIVSEKSVRPVVHQRASNEIHLRFFCTALNKQEHQSVNAPIQTEGYAIASPVSSTAAANIEENWKYGLWTLINPAASSNCEACNIPKSTKDKNLGSSENLIPPVGNPATNLPRCIICFVKERDIAFQPCGHLITCSDCADFRMNYCPICRKDIENKLKVFIN